MRDQERWDGKYNTEELIHGDQPAQFLLDNSALLPSRGLALDIACGEGQNAVFLAECGVEVIALDISVRALQKCRQLAERRGVRVDLAALDLSTFHIPRSSFDVIVNFNYLDRALVPGIVEGLKPGGLLVFETMTIAHLKWKPDFNREFLLKSGELVELFGGKLDILVSRECDIEIWSASRSVASLAARKANGHKRQIALA
ncbi:MAG TPA: class I SAM-dependent methyltransferase [Blastocatellia bacterium]|jgi:SAM-dependent methyltransferase|nr:class I SAM-dependent methyltransferase [Blastocatellia bacterium]